MKTLMIASGPIRWASARFRMFWPSRYMQDVEICEGEDFSKAFPNEATLSYDNYIFQKYVSVSQVAYLHGYGKRVFWDLCDPLYWWEPDKSRQITNYAEKIICSNPGLAEDFTSWYGEEKTVVIPDRLELAHFPKQRAPQNTNPVRFIWYGVAVNRMALFAALANMERLVANGYKIELTIYDDRPDLPWNTTNMFPIYYKTWDMTQENEVLANHDIALLPPYPGPWGHVKSNNKALTAWACGLPVTDGLRYKEMEALVRNPELRTINFQPESVELSAREWEQVLNVQ